MPRGKVTGGIVKLSTCSLINECEVCTYLNKDKLGGLFCKLYKASLKRG